MVLGDLSLYFFNGSSLAMAPVSLHTAQDKITCQKVVANGDGFYIVALCQNQQGQYHAEIISCVAKDQCFPTEKSLLLQNIASATKVQMIDNSLFIYDKTSQSVFVFTLDLLSEDWQANNDLTFNQ